MRSYQAVAQSLSLLLSARVLLEDEVGRSAQGACDVVVLVESRWP